MHETYKAWQQKAGEGGNVKYKLGHEVVGIRERNKKGVRVAWVEDGKEVEGVFDELILAVGMCEL